MAVPKKPQGFHLIQSISAFIITTFERFFFNWGYHIANNPWKFIVACLIFSSCCAVGLLGFNMENRPDKLWIPWNSEFSKDSDWMRKNFPSPIRFHYAIVTAEDVLEPKVIQTLFSIHKQVSELRVREYSWKDICYKLPITKFNQRRRRRSIGQNFSESLALDFTGFEDGFEDVFFQEDSKEEDEKKGDEKHSDPSIDLPDFLYCSIVNSLPEACWESSIIELWDFNETAIESLTKQEILSTINSHTISLVFGRPVNYKTELGGVEYDKDGKVGSAKAIMIRWYAKINQTAIKNGKILSDMGTGEQVDEVNLTWESKLSDLLLNFQMPNGTKLYFNLARSFGDISQKTIWGDASFLAIGFGIVFIYVVFMLGQFNMVEQRPILSLAGLTCVGLAIIVSYGICSGFGIIFGPVHNVLPFLLLGIGIDDMFVIMQSWNNLKREDLKLPLNQKMGLTLKNAGVSITITSLTDFVAFAIGGTTVLPALQSFCIYAAIGVIATYIFQATFFVAWLTLDQRRVEKRLNAFIPCIKHNNFNPNLCSQRQYSQIFFEEIYSKILFNRWVKLVVFFGTLGLVGVNIWGNTLLRQEFNPVWFLPHDSYMFQYVEMRKEYFPGRGYEAFVIMENVTFPENLPQMDALTEKLRSSDSIYHVEDWYSDFKVYANKHFNADLPNRNISEGNFKKQLGKFLFSPSGAKYRAMFRVDGKLVCGETAPNVLLTSFQFKFNTFRGPETHIPAMYEIKGLINNANFTPAQTSTSFVWSIAFATWETDVIITAELYRNMALAMACVLITTLLLIANLPACLMVLTCVCFTLIDVGGMMHFWGLTIDTVSCIDLVLAIGLCVDYAAHIGHAFMTKVGTRDERAKAALRDIGPAVLNGGFSTFLAFVLLIDSRSHVFITFFKIFFLVVLFGLFHGLVFLPVLLSVIGPAPYESADKPFSHNEAAMELNPSLRTIHVNGECGKKTGLLKMTEPDQNDNGQM